MKTLFKCLSVSLLFIILVSCISVRVYSCNLDVVKDKFSGLLYSGPISIDEIQKKYSRELEMIKDSPSNNLWLTFFSKHKDSKCIYEFNSPQKDWDALRGSKGFFAIESNAISGMFILTRN